MHSTNSIMYSKKDLFLYTLVCLEMAVADNDKKRKDDRNFRSHYYEKVGFHGVDERKTLDVLLHEDPISLEKCSSFAVRCTVPASERLRVWKILLGLEARYARNKEHVWRWKVRPYKDSLRFMKSVGKVDDTWPNAQNQTVMWLLFNHALKFDFHKQLTEWKSQNFSAIAESMLTICEEYSDVEAFYLSKGLADMLHAYPEEILDEVVQLYHRVLANNPNTNKLYSHMEKIGLNEQIPLKTWICRGFAGILHPTALEKIWDKVIGGSLKVLVFVALSLVECTKMSLLGCHTAQEAIRYLVSTSEETDDVIAQKGIELWVIDGSHLMPGDHKKDRPLSASLEVQQPIMDDQGSNLAFPMATEIKVADEDDS